MRVRVHWNLHRGGWSITHRGRVVRHCDAILLTDVTFLVSQAGLARMRRLARRRVCAWAEGTPGELPWHGLVDPDAPRVRFDGYGTGCFQVAGKPITRAARVLFRVRPGDEDKGRHARNEVLVLA